MDGNSNQLLIDFVDNEKKYRLCAYISSILCIILTIVVIILFVGRKYEYVSYEHTLEEIPHKEKCIERTDNISHTEISVPTNSENDYKLCTSEECIQTAADLLLSMNTSVHPCDDFYRFTCDRWGKHNLSPSSFQKLEEKIVRESIQFYTSRGNKDDSKPVQQSKDFFESCVDEDTRNKVGYTPLFKYLSKLGLPAVPRFFNFTENETETTKFNFIKTDAAMNKLLNIQLLFNCDVIENMFNNTENVIVFDIPKHKLFGFQGLTLSEKDYDIIKESESDSQASNNTYDKISKARLTYLYYAVHEIISEKYHLPDDFEIMFLEAMNSVQNMDRFVKKLKNVITSSNQDSYNKYTINSLETYTSAFVRKMGYEPNNMWKSYLNELFSDNNISVDDQTLIQILSSHTKYYAGIAGLLSTQSEIHLELWTWWNAVYNLFYHTTTKAETSFYQIIKTIKNDINPVRKNTCAKLVNNHMQYVISSAFANKSFLKTTKPMIKDLLTSIKEAFEKHLNELTWIDSFTKNSIKEKSKAITEFIGFPEWILNNTLLESFYSSVTINNDTYLDNMIEITKFSRIQTFKRLNILNKKEWSHNPLKVNAFNNLLGNKITIPMALINYPFFNRGLDVLNYGALGTIIGHEFVHSFDDIGRKFDRDGNYKPLWTFYAILQFSKRVNCFIKQYDQFYINDLHNYVNGTVTIGENISDNGGLHLAYLAYKKYKESNPQEIKLPGLEKYTSDQLFFISYANIWCSQESVTDLKLLVNDVHTLKRYRVLGNLMNSKEFANTFQCNVGSFMNPVNKCDLW